MLLERSLRLFLGYYYCAPYGLWLAVRIRNYPRRNRAVWGSWYVLDNFWVLFYVNFCVIFLEVLKDNYLLMTLKIIGIF